MATKNEEIKDVTGLSEVKASNRKAAEADLLTSLLEAANYRNDEESIKEIEVRRNGVLCFTFKIHPIGEEEIEKAYKQARIKKKNRRGQYVIDNENVDEKIRKSWIIYLATTEEDKKRIWANEEFMAQKDIMRPFESVDLILNFGEKVSIVNQILEISGMSEDEDFEEETATDEEYAKN